ncbi:MAG: DUF2283 domain-containing protein [Candidatus Rokubacteria bacterium]|nr:DUF2283 domain-containing protein [Candidatus Rokubacteria bacterium]
MKIEYDAEVDALYIELRDVVVRDNVDIEEGVTVARDAKARIVGLEILEASKRLSPASLACVTVRGLPRRRTKARGR